VSDGACEDKRRLDRIAHSKSPNLRASRTAGQRINRSPGAGNTPQHDRPEFAGQAKDVDIWDAGGRRGTRPRTLDIGGVLFGERKRGQLESSEALRRCN